MYRILYKLQTIFKNRTAVNTNIFKKESKESNYDLANRTCYIWKTFWRVCFSNFWREILIKKNWFFNTVPCLQQIILSSTAAEKKIGFKEGFSVKTIVCTIVGVSCLSYEWCIRSTECQPYEFVSCLNQSALIKYIICHIFTESWLASLLAITGITSANH